MPGFEIIDNKEAKAVQDLFKKEKGILFAHGFDKIRKKFHVRDFEKQINIKFKSKFSLAVTSGTAATKIALLALGVKRGDEVITQSFNFVATIEAILDIGAIPKIVNIDKTLNINPDEIQSHITKKTKVILPVHMLGVPADMNRIMNIAKKNKLKVLEDNCEAFGALYKKKYLGTIGDAGVASFDFGKVITCGEGGIITTNSRSIDKYCREYHDHGHENNPNFSRGRDTKKIYGFNYRLTEIQAVICKVQLKKLDFIIKENFKRYKILETQLKKQYKIREIPDGSQIIYDTFIFFVNDKNKRKKIIEILSKKKIGTKNLPDAIEWHCSYYWDHMLNKKSIKESLTSKQLLLTSIAIPIFLKKDLKTYKNIADEIYKII